MMKDQPASQINQDQVQSQNEGSQGKTDDKIMELWKQIHHNNNQQYIKLAKQIQNQAKINSKVVNLQFRKYSKKPQVQTVYVDSSKMHQKLQKMSTRIDGNKYEMIIQVKKDAIDNLAIKKPVIKDQIQNKKYTTIYNQFFNDKNKNKTETLRITTPLVSLYQFYDQQEKDWKDSLKKRSLIYREIRSQVKQKITEAVAKKDVQFQGSQIKFQDWVHGQKYQDMFLDVAIQNHLFDHKKKVPKAQAIVNNLFQNKFYKNRQKKFEKVFNRFQQNKQENEQLDFTQYSQDCQNPQKNNKNKPKTKKIKLNVPEACKRIYNTQNKLLQQNLTKGLSRDHTKKLIVKFNKTILDMKANDQKTTSNNQIPKHNSLFKKQAKTHQAQSKLQTKKGYKSFVQIKQNDEELRKQNLTINLSEMGKQKSQRASTSHSRNFRTTRKLVQKAKDNQTN